MQIGEHNLYERLGEAGFAALAADFYDGVRADDVLAPMYRQHLDQTGEDWPDAEARFREFLIQRFGGPHRYSEARGHPRLRMRHMPFRIDERARDRWLSIMDIAMDRAGTPPEARKILEPAFRHMADFMVNTPG